MAKLGNLKNSLIGMFAAVLLTCSPSSLEAEAPSFAEARRDSSKRQAYLDSLPLIYRKAFPCEVIYDKKDLEIKMNALAVTIGGFTDGIIQKTTVYVGRLAFEDSSPVRTSEDLRHLIESHEYTHAIQNIKGIGKFSSSDLERAVINQKLDILLSFLGTEVDAYHSGSKDLLSGKFKVSPYYRNHQNFLYASHHQRLRELNVRSAGFEKEFILEVLKMTSDLPPQKITFDFRGLLFPF